MLGDQRTVPELISDAINQFSALIRNEVALARAEISSKLSAAAVGMGLVVGGALFAIPAIVLLLMAIAAGLVQLGMNIVLAYLISAIIGLVVSGALVYAGMGRLKPQALTPTRTIAEIRRDVAAVREQS
jgi:hypothetical protein